MTVGGTPFGHSWPGSGGQQNRIGVQFFGGAVVQLGFDGVWAGQGSAALDDPDILGGEQLVVRTLEVTHDALEPLGEIGRVDVRGNGFEAHTFASTQERQGATGRDHGLGRNAIPQMGRAADDVALDQGHLST